MRAATASRPLTILVSGMIGAVPGQGGASWAVLQYLLGFRRLGHEVYLVEPMTREHLLPAGVELAHSANASYCRNVMAKAGLEHRWALLLAGTGKSAGLPYDELLRIGRRADVHLNIAGLLRDEALTGTVPHRVYLDLDPAFVQLWQAVEGIDMRFDDHHHFVTVGQRIGTPDCDIPTCGRAWIHTLPPVVLDEWPVTDRLEHHALTTVGHWRGYGSIHHQGRHYGQKAHSLRPLLALPRRTQERFLLALAIHPDEERDLAALRDNGWGRLDPATVAGSPSAYRRFVQGSKAEFGIAKSGYVVSRCGWFSDRSACYLASGRPVIAQDTGFGDLLPTGRGLFAFDDEDGVLTAIDALNTDYAGHRRAARELAEEHFDSDRVLTELLREVGATH